MFSIFRKDKSDHHPFKFDWGEVTPNQFSKIKNEAVYVFSFDFLSEESRDLANQFAIGKILWHQNHLPKSGNPVIKSSFLHLSKFVLD